jgi:hypothetical protein
MEYYTRYEIIMRECDTIIIREEIISVGKCSFITFLKELKKKISNLML